jgi:hypothetical protein
MTPLEALQTSLAGEHAAIYVYAVVGGRVSDSHSPTAALAVTAAYTTHRARRDQLHEMVRSLGGDPVAPEVAYDLDGPVDSVTQILAQARAIETRCAEVYGQAVASTAGVNRQWAIDALTDAGVRVLSFGGRPQAFPGLPEL